MPLVAFDPQLAPDFIHRPRQFLQSSLSTVHGFFCPINVPVAVVHEKLSYETALKEHNGGLLEKPVSLSYRLCGMRCESMAQPAADDGSELAHQISMFNVQASRSEPQNFI